MQRGIQGYFIPNVTSEEKFKSFVPRPLPPDPPIQWSLDLREKFDTALVSLGRLDSVSLLLPDTSLFIYLYVRKEALLSSMIEGTQSSLSDLLLVDMDQKTNTQPDDIKEVSNYVAAINYGIKRLDGGFPLSLRLIKEIHGILLSTGRGAEKNSGEFRQSQNWIGGSRPGTAVFVPPPPELVLDCMGTWELFLHNQPEKTPILVKLALAHLQFETIHPFLDGNGRVGRLLIPLLLHSEKILKEPLLYISYYFKSNRRRYYELLDETRSTGDWEKWMDFFADAVTDTATQAIDAANRLSKLFAEDRRQIGEMKRIFGSANIIHQAMMEHPIVTSKWLQNKTQLSPVTVNSCLTELEKIGIVQEMTHKHRNRVYSYVNYLKILDEGTEIP